MEIFTKMGLLPQQVWGGASNPTLLTRLQMMPILLVPDHPLRNGLWTDQRGQCEKPKQDDTRMTEAIARSKEVQPG